MDLRTALAYPKVKDEDDYPIFKSREDYYSKPGAKLSTLCLLLQYLLSDDEIKHVDNFDYNNPPKPKRVKHGKKPPVRERKCIVSILWTMMAETIVSVSNLFTNFV